MTTPIYSPSPLQHTELLQDLYSAHHPWLNAWLRRRLGDAADAADLAQDVFLRLMNKPLWQLDNVPKARAYLKAVAQNLATDLWRRRQLEQAWLEALANAPESYAPSAQHQVEVMQTLCELDAMLRSLPAKVSRVFMLKMVCEMTEADIAAELGVSTRMVRKYQAQAMLHCMKLELGLTQQTSALNATKVETVSSTASTASTAYAHAASSPELSPEPSSFTDPHVRWQPPSDLASEPHMP